MLDEGQGENLDSAMFRHVYIAQVYENGSKMKNQNKSNQELSNQESQDLDLNTIVKVNLN